MILNAYVPTGKNKLPAEKEQQFENRFLGALKHASEHNEQVIATGDWNHLTNDWTDLLHAQGFRPTARAGVVVTMVKSRDTHKDGGYCTAPLNSSHPLHSDHPLLYTYLEPTPLEEELLQEISPNRTLLAQHEVEYKEALLRELQLRAQVPNETPTDRMRWAAATMKTIGQQLTREYRRPPGRKRMFYPRRIQKMHEKVSGRIPLAAQETLAQLKKRIARAMHVWTQRRLEKMQQQQDAQYDNNMKQAYRRITATPSNNTHVIEEEATGGYYTQATERDQCARRIIGAHWQGQSPTEPDLNQSQEWMQFVQPDSRDTLESIGAPLTETEIEEAYKRMHTGKATQSDAISKELMELIPPEYKKMFVDYIAYAFTSGTTDLEEGKTDIVLLTKKHDKNEREITNKRPIALVKFVTKWLQAILSHRIQQRIKHLANYGFQPEKGTACAVRKLTALIEYADLHNLPIHMLTVDIEKAYDTVPYALIATMLRAYKCPTHILNLIMTMHKNRTLHFKLNGHVGGALQPERGVAQGSPLSCILFVLCMQPLLLRLQQQTTGLWGAEDDAAYVDDLTLVAGTASQLETKWAIVRSYEEWTNMKVNILKCEYDTTEGNPLKWARIPGVKQMQIAEEQDHTIRVLGFWTRADGERHHQLSKIVRSIRMLATHTRRKLISPAIAKGVINHILNSRLNYIAQLHEIPDTQKHAIKQEIHKLARQQFGLSAPTTTARLYSYEKWGGLGLEDSDNVADRAYVAEYLIALNSQKEQYTAAILHETAGEIREPSRDTQPRDERHLHSTTHMRVVPGRMQEARATVEFVAYRDTQHAQGLRCAQRLGLSIRRTKDWETSLRGQQRMHHQQEANGQHQLRIGEIIWIKHIETGGRKACGVPWRERAQHRRHTNGPDLAPKISNTETGQSEQHPVPGSRHHAKTSPTRASVYRK